MILTGKEPKIPAALMFVSNCLWWEDVVVRQKNLWMKTKKFKGDMPPLVMAIKDKCVIAYVIAPELDKYAGLNAAKAICRVMQPDSIMFVADGHMPIGSYREVIHQQVTEGTYRNGDMQKLCDEEDACVAKKLTDCMVLNWVSKGGDLKMHTLCYDYRGDKGNVEIEWTPQHNISMGLSEISAEGILVDGLKKAILPRDYTRRDIVNGALGMMRQEGYEVWNLLDNPVRVEK